MRGAFTGARREAAPGQFELADGGTLFLDEIGEMPLDIQPKLLRVLEEPDRLPRRRRARARQVDVRVVAATNRDLKAEVAAGRFREDLYYRLSVVTITSHRLRERGDDVVLLVEPFHRPDRGADRPGAT